jgi:phospholipid N-methyltransferase
MRALAMSPGSTGAITPSSRWLAKKIVAQVPIEESKVIVEFGPGTGSFTGAIAERVSPDACFFAIELNPNLARFVTRRFPGVKVYNDSVANISELCACEGVDGVDCVISGLPWANFPDELQETILDAMIEMMTPGGTFTTFAYLHGLNLPGGRAFRKRLEDRFSTVELTEPVWLNIPPALCYRCVL